MASASAPRATTTVTTSEETVQRLAKEVAGLQGVGPRDRGMVFKAITRKGEELGQFSQGGPGDPLLVRVTDGCHLEVFDDDEEEGY